MATVLAAFGCDPVLIETVGAGQDKVAIVRAAQTIVVVEAPHLGDDVQTIKAGLVEIADVFAVNKADKEGAGQVAVRLRFALGLSERPSSWTPPIVKTIATTGASVPALADAIERHVEHLRQSGEIAERARAGAARGRRVAPGSAALAIPQPPRSQSVCQRGRSGRSPRARRARRRRSAAAGRRIVSDFGAKCANRRCSRHVSPIAHRKRNPNPAA